MEEEEEEEHYEDDILQDAGPHMLMVERRRTDDSFVGRLSKYVFQRAPYQEHISLTYHQEITLYIRYHILPLLREILHGSRERFFIWLAACAQYYKENDSSEICERWSSHRNENWYSPILDSRQECEDFILAITDDFVTDMTADVEQMSSYFGSAWQFLRVKVFHLRFAKAEPHNLIRFGIRPKRSDSFHPDIRPLFSNYVIDPEPFALVGVKAACVPISIVLSVLLRESAFTPNTLGKKQVAQGLNTLRFQHLLHRPDGGINLSDFKRLESANTPLPMSFTDRFPSVSQYKGLALNLFRAVLHRDGNHKPMIYFFPSRLSPHHEDSAFLQIDLLLDSPELRPKKAPIHSESSALHILAIPNLIKLLAMRHGDENTAHNSTRYDEICRQCCRIFTAREDLEIHRRCIYLISFLLLSL